MQSVDSTHAELLTVTQRLLDAIANQDWATYDKLCDSSLTCFEPEARGHLVEGMGFHRFYFELKGGGGGRRQTTLCAPHVRVMGDVAVVSYTRLTQVADAAGKADSFATEETRVWRRSGADWRLVHFHRSPCP